MHRMWNVRVDVPRLGYHGVQDSKKEKGSSLRIRVSRLVRMSGIIHCNGIEVKIDGKSTDERQ